MTTTTTLVGVRRQLVETYAFDLAEFGVELGWDGPAKPEDLASWGDSLTAVFFVDPVDVSVDPDTLTGLREEYVQEIAIRCLPRDGSVTAEDALVRAQDILTVLVAPLRPRLRLTVDDWAVQCTWAGHSSQSGRLNNPPGSAAGFNVRIRVEAWTC